MNKSGRIDVGHTKNIGDKTLEAIDVIGKDTSTQIKAIAEAHMERAVKLQNKLLDLAAAIEDTMKQAAADLKSYTDHTIHVLETVQGLQVKLNGVKEPGVPPEKLPITPTLDL